MIQAETLKIEWKGTRVACEKFNGNDEGEILLSDRDFWDGVSKFSFAHVCISCMHFIIYR